MRGPPTEIVAGCGRQRPPHRCEVAQVRCWPVSIAGPGHGRRSFGCTCHPFGGAATPRQWHQRAPGAEPLRDASGQRWVPRARPMQVNGGRRGGLLCNNAPRLSCLVGWASRRGQCAQAGPQEHLLQGQAGHAFWRSCLMSTLRDADARPARSNTAVRARHTHLPVDAGLRLELEGSVLAAHWPLVQPSLYLHPCLHLLPSRPIPSSGNARTLGPRTEGQLTAATP